MNETTEICVAGNFTVKDTVIKVIRLFKVIAGTGFLIGAKFKLYICASTLVYT